MEKKKKKVLKLKLLPLFIFFIFLLFLYLLYILMSDIKIKNIYVNGNTYLTEQEILEIAKLDDYPSFLKTSVNTIKKRLNKSPYIKKVSVKKKLFNKVILNIEEEKLLFRKADNNLVVLENKKEIDDKGIYNIPVLLNYIPDTKYDSFIKGMNKVDKDIIIQISEIKYDPNNQDDDRFLLYMNDGNYVYLTLTKFKQINYYEDVLKTLEGKKGILYLDSGNHFKIMEE